MKWTLFPYGVDRAFTTDAKGKCLFFLHGPFSRPYVLPNAEVKDKLRRKLLWYNRTNMAVLFAIIFAFSGRTAWLIYFAAAGLVLSFPLIRLVFHHDLKSLPRGPRKTLKECFAIACGSPSRTLLALTMTLYWVLAFAMMVLLLVGAGSAIIVILMLLFVIVAIGCGYALFLKE